MRELSRWPNQHPPQLANTQPEYMDTPPPEEPSLRDYWRMLRKRRRLVLLVLLMMLGLGVAVTVFWTPQYTATTTLRVDAGTPPAAGFGEIKTNGEEYLDTQVALLKSNTLAAKVILEMRLESHPKFVDSQNPIQLLRNWMVRPLVSGLRQMSDFASERVEPEPTPVDMGGAPRSAWELGVHPFIINRYKRLLEVETVRNTSLIRVSFTTIDPSLSRDLAASHTRAFIRQQLETRFELTKEAREFLEKKLAEVSVKLEKSEQVLQRFRQAHSVVSVAAGENVVVDRLVDLNRRLTEARSKRIELESLSRMVKGKNAEYLSQIVENNLIVQFKGRLEGLEADRARTATIFKPDHPRLVELDQQIREARRRLNAELNNVVRGIESDYSASRAREAALQAEAEQQQRAALDFKEMGVQYNILQQEVDANRGVYDNVLKRLNETSISSDSPLSNMQVTEPAEKPLQPSLPNPLLNMLAATFLGLGFGVGMAFLLEHLDSTVRTAEDIWRGVGVPTLGVVPDLKALPRRDYRPPALRRLTSRLTSGGSPLSPALMMSSHPLTIIGESYRIIRTVLLLGQPENPPRVLLLTSVHPAEGKTTVALSLAITLAQSGRTVVVVDADLRKGNCHAQLGTPNRYGLTHLLTDDMPLEACVQSTGVTGLSLLPRGGFPLNPTDLLGSNKMREVLAALRDRFDFVVIDSPPGLAISDAAILSPMCDGVLLVLRSQNTTTDAARQVVERLQAVGGTILGAILNRINIREPDYAGYRHYYSSYYVAARKEDRKFG